SDPFPTRWRNPCLWARSLEGARPKHADDRGPAAAAFGGRRQMSLRQLPAIAAFFGSTVLVLASSSVITQAAAPSAALTDTPAATLRVTLNRLGEEHVYLAGAALSAAVAGRNAELDVASQAVDKNTQELGDAVGTVYGA